MPCTITTPVIDATQHLGLARHLANKFRRRALALGYDTYDLFSEACLALLGAAETFDSSRGDWAPHAAVVMGQRLARVLNHWKPLEQLPTNGEGEAIDVGDYRHTEEPLAREDVEQLLRVLPARQRLAIELRFGLSESGKLTLQEIGGRLQISKERVRQIILAGLRKLRQRVGEGGLATSLRFQGAQDSDEQMLQGTKVQIQLGS